MVTVIKVDAYSFLCYSQTYPVTLKIQELVSFGSTVLSE